MGWDMTMHQLCCGCSRHVSGDSQGLYIRLSSGIWEEGWCPSEGGFNHRCAGDPDLTLPNAPACCSPPVYLPAITFTQYLKITFVINVQFN